MHVRNVRLRPAAEQPKNDVQNPTPRRIVKRRVAWGDGKWRREEENGSIIVRVFSILKGYRGKM